MMPLHGFMAADLVQSVAALCLYPLFVFIPGYVLSWFADLFDFRRRSNAFRIALSVTVSISICPIVIYLVGRFASMTAVWCLFAALWLCFLPIAYRSLRWPAGWRQLTLAAGIWAVLALLSLVDLQWGHRLYFSTVALDYSVRTEFIHSISTTGIPPANPFFYPGHAVPLRYHYFWMLVCSLVEQLGGSWVGARAAWIAGAVWCGFGLMALVTLFLRLVWYRGPADFRSRAVCGVALAGVTGLDIIPNLGLWVLHAMGMHHAIKASVDWWNEQIAGFTSTALWEAHYVCSLIACLTVFLLLWQAPRRALYGAIAGMALATAAGAAIYIAFVFAVFLGLRAAISLAKRRWRETAVLAIAGAAAILLFLPFARDLLTPAARGGAAIEAPLQFGVRPFSPVNVLLRPGPAVPIVNALMLPLNYFLELGVFFAAAVLWWRGRRQARKPLAAAEVGIATMVVTSVILCSFVRSSVIANNDLGWRGFLIAQFGLLLWAVDVLSKRRTAFLTALVALGVAGTVYDVLMLRFFPVMADAGIVSPAGWMAPDRQLGERTYAAREAYAHLPAAARLQFNPHVDLQDTYAFLYSSRQIVAADEGCLANFGGDPADCAAMAPQLKPFYDSPAPQSIAGLCRTLPVDVLVAKDLDPVWSDRQSWVWKESPIFANGYFRLFSCHNVVN